LAANFVAEYRNDPEGPDTAPAAGTAAPPQAAEAPPATAVSEDAAPRTEVVPATETQPTAAALPAAVEETSPPQNEIMLPLTGAPHLGDLP
jgi:hypothetical protein